MYKDVDFVCFFFSEMKFLILLTSLLALASANVLRPSQMKITQCALVRCGYGAVCEVDENDQASCVCRMECKNEEDLPFCGEDGTQYDNMCQIEKKICEAQRMINYLPGKCTGECYKDW